MQPLDPRVVAAIDVLAAAGYSYAEIRRAIAPAASRAGVPRPAYTTVRRLAREHRDVRRARRTAASPVLEKLLAGRLPSLYELERLRESFLEAPAPRS